MAQSSFLEKDNPVEFLYVDKQRISSLTGQLSDRGVLTGYRSTVAKTTLREGQTGLGLPAIAKADVKASQTASESAEEIYDPFWTHAYSFLQDLEANYAVPLDHARLGSLVKFEAAIQFVDLGLVKNLWGPALKAHQWQNQQASTPASGNRKQRREQSKAQLSPDMSLSVEILKEVPHLFHMTFLSLTPEAAFYFWASVRQEFLTIPSADLTMKYGSALDGIWSVVGIIDAKPGLPPEPFRTNELMDGVVSTLDQIRRFVGRPLDYFGITPIAIYTPLAGAAESAVTASETHNE